MNCTFLLIFHINWLANLMDLSLSWEAASYTATQEFPNIRPLSSSLTLLVKYVVVLMVDLLYIFGAFAKHTLNNQSIMNK
jgi:hypothetical protein